MGLRLGSTWRMSSLIGILFFPIVGAVLSALMAWGTVAAQARWYSLCPTGSDYEITRPPRWLYSAPAEYGDPIESGRRSNLFREDILATWRYTWPTQRTSLPG